MMRWTVTALISFMCASCARSPTPIASPPSAIATPHPQRDVTRAEELRAARPRTLAVGAESVCALDSAGTPWCWGFTEWGLLGPSKPLAPFEVPVPWTSLVGYLNVYCGVTEGHEVHCILPHASPRVVELRELGQVTDVVTGALSACGLGPDGDLRCCSYQTDGDVVRCGEPFQCDLRGVFVGSDRGAAWSASGDVVRLERAHCEHVSATASTVWGGRVDGRSPGEPAAPLRALQTGLGSGYEPVVCRGDGALIVAGNLVDTSCFSMRAGPNGLCIAQRGGTSWRCLDIANFHDFPGAGRFPVPADGWYALPAVVDDVAIQYRGCFRQGAAITCWEFGGPQTEYTRDGGLEQRVFWRGEIGAAARPGGVAKPV